MEIKVLGSGCPRCEQTASAVKEALTEADMNATVEKVTDTMEIAGYGVFGTPAVVIDEGGFFLADEPEDEGGGDEEGEHREPEGR